MASITEPELDRRFDLHTPTDPTTNATLDSLRAQFKSLARTVILATGANPREQAVAIKCLEDGLSATIAAVVRPPA
ncbi:hypothetical protein I5G59_gp72 [Mycobacterium phage LilMcDreamy]|uniref:Uncharacterized protein n=1 Tax=Mycobacterium phage LilMcDreamy TaxID=2652422 RepID=A0A5P8D8D0_9CAUD|nr:hypothetical protein I5G59_gp72 [Mycobacterium phage LilMcDreamy]QFP94692.1 hypothetical protein SEA_LILMCDREAMY_72 [Mycobacterium phage LilMcDreamy]